MEMSLQDIIIVALLSYIAGLVTAMSLVSRRRR